MRSAARLDIPKVPTISGSDDRWTCRQVVEVVSVGASSSLVGIGSSAYPGDLGITGVEIPVAVPPANGRYFVRLGAIEIPKGSGLVILQVKQLALIGATFAATNSQAMTGKVTLPIPVTTPTWSFTDGNISWHVRWTPNRFSRNNPADATAEASGILAADTGFDGTDAAILYEPPFVSYVPVNNGVPPGVAVGSLGTIRDMRYRWESNEWPLNTFVRGPGVITYYASVKQTDPVTRLQIPAALTADQRRTLCPEDQYVAAFEGKDGAVYTRVAGALVVDLIPDCSRNVEQGGALRPLDYYELCPECQRPHGKTAALTAITSATRSRPGR